MTWMDKFVGDITDAVKDLLESLDILVCELLASMSYSEIFG